MTSFFRDEVNKLLKQASDSEAVGISILVTVLIVSPIIIMLVQNAVATIQVRKECSVGGVQWKMIDDCKYFAALFIEFSTKGERVEDGAEEKWCYSLSNVADKRGYQIEANPSGA